MTKLARLRQIVDPEANSGSWNMAVDEVLLQSAIDHGMATLRWYASREPTVSLGYFQSEKEILEDARLSSLPRVRRLSGGGTLVHDQELTYSLTLPVSQQVIDRPVELYRLVHQVFIDVFRERGAEVEFRGLTIKLAEEPVLCFERQDEHDLVMKGQKILGSVQRRRRGAILQHGGLLLKASSVTPELPGIRDLCPAVDMSELAQSFGKSFLREIAETLQDEALTGTELRMANRIVSESSH